MTFKIRRVVAEDRNAWQELWKGYQRFYKVDLDKTTASTWERLLAANEDPDCEGPHGMVAVDQEGKLLGFTHYLFHVSAWSPKPRCYLNDLFTLEEARGRGVGRSLIEAVYAAADQHDCEQTYWLTQEFNQDARALYDKVANVTPFIKYSR